MKESICFALDGLKTQEEILFTVKELKDYVGYYKVGLAAFSLIGPTLIQTIKHEGGKVFLDLKLHDIPNTVMEASQIATELGVDIFNVHAGGGLKMMQAAVEGVKRGMEKRITPLPPKLIGVTILTSMNDLTLSEVYNQPSKVADQALHLAQLTATAGLDGIVSSAHEIPHMKSSLPDDFFYITPGIRLTSIHDDQERVMHPKKALENGSSLLVVGRAIKSKDDAKELLECIK